MSYEELRTLRPFPEDRDPFLRSLKFTKSSEVLSEVRFGGTDKLSRKQNHQILS